MTLEDLLNESVTKTRPQSPETVVPMSDIFAEVEQDLKAKFNASQTPGTPEYAADQAFARAYNERLAANRAAVVSAGGVLAGSENTGATPTHTENGEPIADADADADGDVEEEEDGDIEGT